MKYSFGPSTESKTRPRRKFTSSKKWVILLCAISATFCASIVLGVHAFNSRARFSKAPIARQLNGSSGGSNLRGILSRQPEADRMRRRLGRRFLEDGFEVSLITGTLTIGANQLPLTIARTQRDEGERVEVSLAGRQSVLAWDAVSGASLDGRPAAQKERTLLERLSLDSVDQFIQAQVRGASYYLVARDVRPAGLGASDDYDGPVWDVVRITEPAEAVAGAPLSHTRHYFINSSTGLIERVASVEQGSDIVAELSGWVSQAGESIPTHIVWTQDGQVAMELSVSGFSNKARK